MPTNNKPDLRHGILGAILVVGLGLLLWGSRLGDGFVHLSYDLPVALKPVSIPQEVIIAYLDETSLRALGQERTSFNRRKHAEILRHLTRDGARLVVYDIWFKDERTPEENEPLAQAMRDHGNVVIAVTLETSSIASLTGTSEQRPLELFEEAAAGLGVSHVHDRGSIVRQYVPGTPESPSLPWEAARRSGDPFLDLPKEEPLNNWINYYGPPGRIRSIHLSEVTAQDPGFFQDKYVFIGSRPLTADLFDEAEEFKVPHNLWSNQFSAGVEIWAHAFLNLIRGEWLQRWAAFPELMLVICSGLILGVGLVRLPFRWGLFSAGFMMILLAAAGFYFTWTGKEWFCWSLVAGAQFPAALGWSFWVQFRSVSRQYQHVSQEKETLEEQLATVMQSRPDSGGEAAPFSPGTSLKHQASLADHTLLRCVGRGAYGEVWLARNAVGMFHAVKIIYQQALGKENPFEREFQGIKKFMPVSRSHDGLVDVLHVGRNDAEGYFYYVMEPADDREAGAVIEPVQYQPKSLASVLDSNTSLSATEAARLALPLTQALHHLHEHGLIHRDIKPANIIFVNQRPKLADIGLVTEIRSTGQAVTLIGTEGYIAPEGPGTPAADVFSLGKVLYQSVTGMDPNRFPEMPTAVYDRKDYAQLKELNRIIGKACDHDLSFRYPSAAAMGADLHKMIEGD